jgi:protein ImuB
MLRLRKMLSRHGKAARALSLDLFRLDGAVTTFAIALARPSCDPDHVAKLAALRLARADTMLAPGFGFETVSLVVTKAEAMRDVQAPLSRLAEDKAEDEARLIDRLRQKLGEEAVHYLKPFASHVPERAERPAPETSSWSDAPRRARPLLLLDEPAPVDVLAPVPEGLPHVLHWQGSAHRIAHLEGPERIGPEWWRMGDAETRDYYRIEDRAGRRFWLFRARAQWFLHGLFP